MGILISDEYREMNKELHATRKTYGASGHKWADIIGRVAGGITILDYGCGKGTLKEALPWANIREYDPAIEGKDAEPEPAQLVVCTDVLEHIEPDNIESVLRHIKSLMMDAGFLVIATRPANKTLPDGRNAHLILEDRSWWLGLLTEHFEVSGVKENETTEGEFSCIIR